MALLEMTRRELKVEESYFSYDEKKLESLEPFDKHNTIIGQPRAMQALKMGFSVASKGYNIYVSGDPGTGRSTAIKEAATPFLQDLSLLKDIAFVHNFRHPDKPIAVTFECEMGRKFALAMQNFINLLKQKIKESQNIDQKSLSDLASSLLEPIKKEFNQIELQNYFAQVQQDLLEHAYLFNTEDQNGLPQDSFYLRYSVNLLVDHSQTKERPLIFENHPTFANLFGSLDALGDRRDDRYLPFLAIHAGSLLQSAGGYMVISAEEMLTTEGLWEAFKRFLQTSALVIQNASYGSAQVSPIRPEPVPLNLKVVLVGSEESYEEFCQHDFDFLKLFKVSAEFDYSMQSTDENIKGVISYLYHVVNEENLAPLEMAAVAELLRYSALLAESRDELTTQLSLVADLLREANYWGKLENKTSIDKKSVLKALEERSYITSVTESRIFNEIATGEMIIALEGTKIGVVNGLAVLDRGFSYFGTPTVISATVAPGTEGIVNIEHEAGLSGEIHDKGLLILEGYLRKRYARTFPLSIYSGICFEQSYAEVDGDSASSSELYALLSAIGEIPIKQNIAVTGSVNQMGELQPVGGINEKISGFYSVCKKLNLKNHPGVIIPIQNIKSLILPYEIIEAIEKKEFHIYPVKNIDEGMQILTDRVAGERNQKGNFPVNTFNKIIEDRLKALYEISRPQV